MKRIFGVGPLQLCDGQIAPVQLEVRLDGPWGTVQRQRRRRRIQHADRIAAWQPGGRRAVTLIKPLGQGSMGEVWLARDERLGEEQALKFPPPEVGADEEALDNLRKEVAKCRHLSHPNIVRIYDLHQEPGEPPFISMEYVDGATLEALRLRQPKRVFSWDHLKPLVQPLCDALEYAHSEGIIYRDLKPSNLMLDAQGRIKLADLGIAAALVDPASHGSVPGSSTVPYLSPQQLNGEPPVVTDDIYSLGATLYELLTSKPPFFSGDIPHQVRKIAAKPMEQRQAELGVTNPVPEGEAAMVMACLAKRPRLRPQSAHQVARWVGLEVRRRLNVPSLAERAPGEAVEELDEFEVEQSGESGELDEAFGKMELRRQFIRRTALICAVVVAGAIIGFGLRWKALRDAENSKTAQSATNAPATAPETKTKKIIAGSRDRKFDVSGGPDASVTKFDIDGNNRVVIGGYFTNVDGIKRLRVARLNADGLLDRTFDPGEGPDDYPRGLAVQPDGKVVICGNFSKVGGKPTGPLARLNTDGSVDTTFRPGIQRGSIHAVAVMADGRIIGGGDTGLPSAPMSKVFRMKPNGTPDPAFKGPSDYNRPDFPVVIQAVGLQPDGKILVGGSFTEIDGQRRGRIARLNKDGSLDASFEPSPGATGGRDIWKVAAAPDGKVFLLGGFTQVNGVPRHGLARLNADGSLDTSFNPDVFTDGSVSSLAVQADGKVLVGGDFHSSAGADVAYLARLDANGTVDTTFEPKAGIDNPVRAVEIQPDGQILISGSLHVLGGHKVTRVVRLNGDSRPF